MTYKKPSKSYRTPVKVQDAMKNELAKYKCRLFYSSRLNLYGDDAHLYMVVALRENNSMPCGEEYIVWYWNDSTKSLSNGSYGLSLPLAMNKIAQCLMNYA